MAGKSRPQCSLFLENMEGEILLQLRDDKKEIPYPNCLGTFGGQIEENETKENAIVREIAEEIEGYVLQDFNYLGNYPFDGYDVHFFYKKDLNFNLNKYVIKEGQRGFFVGKNDLNKYAFAFNAKEILKKFFEEKEVKTRQKESLKKPSKIGYGITFVDLDETIFHTFANINIIKDEQIIKKLTNKEFNSYILEEGESFDFSEFSDSKLFYETSKPIPETIERLKIMIKRIKETKSFSRIIILTARQDFSNKDPFLKTFSDNGIDVSNKEIIYIDRAGKINAPTIADKKRIEILKYLETGIYRKCRMIDDDLTNLEEFIKLESNLPEHIKKKISEQYNLKEKDKHIKFYALHIQPNGKLKKL
ncbi:MAG: NUDIX domain-containing protein [Candidatus Woesearchaeota archaeon]